MDLLCASMVLVYIILMFQSKLASAGEAAAVPLRKSHQCGCIERVLLALICIVVSALHIAVSVLCESLVSSENFARVLIVRICTCLERGAPQHVTVDLKFPAPPSRPPDAANRPRSSMA